jgi:hypothetical protein
MERVRKRKLIENGAIQDNYCDVCGLETRVYAFECSGDEAIHMYCYYCAFAVTTALETFMREHRIGR